MRAGRLAEAAWYAAFAIAAGTAAAVHAADPAPGPAGKGNPSEGERHIAVDQFGYRPGDTKVAVIRSPQVGFDASDAFTPGPRYEVRRLADDQTVFAGTPVPWNGGATQDSSGDKGWWFDFSALAAPGRYTVVDVERAARSPAFNIDENVYKPVLRAAVRMYFYQRSGFAKRAPYADACWTDEAAYLGRDQDGEARDITDPRNDAKVRDLSGGWFDAGDTNKYVTFAVQPVHQLLDAYQDNPAVFTDDFGIPESGNGIPDLVDEVKWETDWLKKMQFPDGGAALKVGETVYAKASPPSADATARFYVPACTSATIAVAGMLAHASFVYRQFPALAAEAAELQARSISAWNNFHKAPQRQGQCDSGIVHSGNADLQPERQNALAAEAAIYLFAITGEAGYHEYLKSHYREMQPYQEPGWTRYNPDQGEALLFYTTLPRADPGLKARILADKLKDVQAGSHIYRFEPRDDLYRAFLHEGQYHWGSNNPRANYGNTNLDALRYAAVGKDANAYRQRALGILHYFHGVNPLGIVYLSNMYALGATRSVNELLHAWFASGTKWNDARLSSCGPAPGYVPGGPDANAVLHGVAATVIPPAGQPAQKSYRDWNGLWPESSWVVNEPGIYYQAAYVKLLSAFAQ